MEKKSILIVEDERIIALELKKNLDREGYNSKVVNTPEDAVSAVEEYDPDLILMDIHLREDRDGIQAVHDIKKVRSDIPHIFVSAFTDEDTIKRAKETNPAGFLVKPIDEKELHTNIAIILQNYELERKLKEIEAQTAQVISQSEEKYRTLFERMAQGVVYFDSDGKIISLNPAAKKILGFNETEVIGRSIFEPVWHAINPDGTMLSVTEYPSVIALTMGKEVNNKIMGVTNNKDRELRWLDISAVPLFHKGEDMPYQAFITFEDITALKKSKRQADAALKEKEALIKEVHHRVKNNFQVISSLLSLQSELFRDPESRELFNESRNRIRIMAMIHELLYQTETFSKISSYDYFIRLISYLTSAYNINQEQIAVNPEIEDQPLSIDAATCCGQIINELISNSCKYAFPEDRKGEITVEFKKQGDRYILRIKDNGIGFSQTPDLQTIESLGLTLVNTFAMQLHGTIELTNHDGTEFTISFKAE